MNFKKTIKEKIENAKNQSFALNKRLHADEISQEFYNHQISILTGEVEAYQDCLTHFSVTIAYLLDTYKRALKSLKQLREPAKEKEAMKNHLMGSISTLELLLKSDEII